MLAYVAGVALLAVMPMSWYSKATYISENALLVNQVRAQCRSPASAPWSLAHAWRC